VVKELVVTTAGSDTLSGEGGEVVIVGTAAGDEGGRRVSNFQRSS